MTYPVQGGPALPVAIVNETLPSAGGTTTVEQLAYGTVRTGEVAGSASAAQLPSVASKLAKVKARSDNAASVYLGWSNSVTKPDGTLDTTTGFELAPGEETGWLPISNLDLLWQIGAVGDDLTYMVLR